MCWIGAALIQTTHGSCQPPLHSSPGPLNTPQKPLPPGRYAMGKIIGTGAFGIVRVGKNSVTGDPCSWARTARREVVHVAGWAREAIKSLSACDVMASDHACMHAWMDGHASIHRPIHACPSIHASMDHQWMG